MCNISDKCLLLTWLIIETSPELKKQMMRYVNFMDIEPESFYSTGVEFQGIFKVF